MSQEKVTNKQAPINEINFSSRVSEIYTKMNQMAIASGVSTNSIQLAKIRPNTLLYMCYWYQRLHSNKEEQSKVYDSLVSYIGTAEDVPGDIAHRLISVNQISVFAKEFVETLQFPQKTVDLVFVRGEKDRAEIATMLRPNYPEGNALPGGFVLDTDEDNELGVPAQLFTALRVAGEKVLHVSESEKRYYSGIDESGRGFIAVQGEAEEPIVKIYAEDGSGYAYRENYKSMLRPTDPRHLVDTHAYRCELIGDLPAGLVWRKKSEIMSPSVESGGFSLPHHREIVAHISSQTSVEKERSLREKDFIRGLIRSPLESYNELRDRFAKEGDGPEVSFPELFPVVDRLLSNAYSEEMNAICSKNPILAGIRDKATISLRHVSLKNRIFCPYLPTLLAINEMLAFYDVVARDKRSFYSSIPHDKVVEHNPAETPNASYHMYRYKYRVNQLMMMVPKQIVVPTFESLSATDLMRLRGVPIRFVGLSEDFLYVDEFEQSPEEFFAHDANHSWRMIEEDKQAQEKYGRTQDQLLTESNQFIDEYLEKIRIRKDDTEEVREMKKLKKIILFEIVHEDARPFLRDVICAAIQTKEGGAVPFEVPRIDQRTGYMDVVDTLDTGISTLSYVRNKLQHGFYDQVDAQLPQIVDPKYRTSKHIAWAAYDMLQELGATPASEAKVDYYGNVSYDWLLKRTISAGPDNIHDAAIVDDAVDETSAVKLNPRRYQANIL